MFMLVLVSCEDKETEKNGQNGSNSAETSKLSFSGKILPYDKGTTAFQVQLVKGDVKYDGNSTLPNAQVFVTEKGNEFQFDNLQSGTYTLIATKKGYSPTVETINVTGEMNYPGYILMSQNTNAGISGKLQILGEDGQDISEIKFSRNTSSVYFLLFNGNGTDAYWDYNDSYGCYCYKYMVVIDHNEYFSSTFVQELKPSSGTLKPNEIVLVEIVIDPLIYIIKEHNTCEINITTYTPLSRQQSIVLSY
ncbi:hypothetical protein FACS189434_06060 [Bacteroidia bacterium]|nr:hypothetical protein FACS189434_06060 [Bacteroidia bacterium]